MPDQRLTELNEMLAVTDGDVFYVVDDPAGTPISKNISFSTMKSYFGGGGGCVTHTCGATGWRGTGGTSPRTLVHEVAFQLDTGGNARGAYAVDFQQRRFDADDVAAGDYSILMTNNRGEIHPDAIYCTAVGQGWDYFVDFGGNVPWDCHIIGDSSLVYGNSTQCCLIGEGHTATDSSFCMAIGNNNLDFEGSYGCVLFMEINEITENAFDGSYYSFSGGIGNDMLGENHYCFQWGEDVNMEGNGNGAGEYNWVCAQFGFYGYIGTAIYNNISLGQGALSYLPTREDFYDGRVVFGSDAYSYVPGQPGASNASGHNQDSWFAQSDLITTWNVAWTTSRFEFPIYEDSVWHFVAYIAGTEQGCTNSFAWKIEGVAENSNNTTTILTSTVTNFYRDVATKEWQVIADDANDRFAFQFRDTGGPDATNCNIQFLMKTTEVGYYGV